MAKTQLVDLDKLQRTDHDTLVRLETKVDTFVSQYAVDMKEIKDGTSNKLADHDIKINALIKTIEEFQPVATLKLINEDHNWVHDYKLTWKLMLGAAAITGGLVSWILNNISTWLHLGK